MYISTVLRPDGAEELLRPVGNRHKHVIVVAGPDEVGGNRRPMDQVAGGQSTIGQAVLWLARIRCKMWWVQSPRLRVFHIQASKFRPDWLGPTVN